MSQLSEAVEAFRKALLTREDDALADLSEVFLRSYANISAQLTELQKTVAARKKQKLPITEGWLAKEQRFIDLITQVTTELSAFAIYADTHISEGQRIAISDAQANASELIKLAQGPIPGGTPIPATFTRFNPIATFDLIGKLSEGSPLRDLLKTVAPQGVTNARQVLVESLVKGDNPNVTARALREELNVSLTRAATIARTEILGAYRQASIDTYRANNDVVKGWVWEADFSSRTCAMCLAMSGTFHELDEPFASHPNCRCTPVPVTKTWEELGFQGIADTRPVLTTGVEWFDKQTDNVKLAILGKEKLELYKAGKLDLKDLIGEREDSKWGLTRYEKSLKQVLAAN